MPDPTSNLMFEHLTSNLMFEHPTLTSKVNYPSRQAYHLQNQPSFKGRYLIRILNTRSRQKIFLNAIILNNNSSILNKNR